MDVKVSKPEPKSQVSKDKKSPAKQAEPLLPSRLGAEFDHLHSEIDRMFDRMMSNWDFPNMRLMERPLFGSRNFPFLEKSLGTGMMFSPKVDLSETDKGYEITTELAGMDEKEIEVVVADDILTIKGQKEEKYEKEEKDFHLSERQFGSFSRSLDLPENVNQDKIDAQFADGVLKIVMPKSKETKKKEKRISVNSSKK